MSGDTRWLTPLRRGLVIPACPLALTPDRTFDEQRQRGLLHYYLSAGAGGLAVGVHTTQFAIRDPAHGLFRPVLQLAADLLKQADTGRSEPVVRIAGLCGPTSQAVQEAGFARDCGYHAGLLSLGALGQASEQHLLNHCCAVADVMPLMGFYLQPAAGGRLLPYSFWRRFAEIPQVVAIKIAPFNRYQTLDVVRAVVEAGRDDIALYTGNDDTIITDLLTPFWFRRNGRPVIRRIVGGLLGQWAVGTRCAVQLLAECHRLAASQSPIPLRLLQWNAELTDLNSAIFDAACQFAGCISGIHEILRRQGLLEGIWCLDPQQCLSPGQVQELDRVWNAYPYLLDQEPLPPLT